MKSSIFSIRYTGTYTKRVSYDSDSTLTLKSYASPKIEVNKMKFHVTNKIGSSVNT